MKLEGMTALSLGGKAVLNNATELEAALRFIGETRYHSLHPFHKLLHGGKLNKGQVQAWALNRYYYQSTIPIKDAVVISRFRDRATRAGRARARAGVGRGGGRLADEERDRVVGGWEAAPTGAVPARAPVRDS